MSTMQQSSAVGAADVSAKRKPFGSIPVNTASSMASSRGAPKSKSVNKPRKTITSITRQSKASTEQKEQPQQVFREEPRSVFRESPFLSMDNQLQDMLTLKRANPIFDSDDEEDYESPTKKVRTFDADVRDDELSQEQRTFEQILDWDDRQVEDEIEGFQLIKIIH